MKLFGHLSVYGLLIAAAVALGVFYCTRQEKRLGLPKDTGVDFALWVMPAALIGARLYYVAFQWGYYSQNPLKILYVWEGGLAIYGGVLGGALGAAYAVLNFYMLGVTVQRVADMADSGEQDEKIAKARMKSSYTTRMVLMVGVVIVAFVLPFVDVLACIIPMLFPRLTILALQLTGKVKSE